MLFGKARIYTSIVPNCKQSTLQAIIKGQVDVSSAIYTHGWPGYDGLVDIGYGKHFRVNHGKDEFAFKGEDGATVAINRIESFCDFWNKTSWRSGLLLRDDYLSSMAIQLIWNYILRNQNGCGIEQTKNCLTSLSN